MADRTTIGATHVALREALTDALVEDPPTVQKPFRRLISSRVDDATAPRPCLGLALARTKTMAAADDDRIVELTFVVRVVADVATADAHASLAAMTGRIEDVLDSWREGGFLEGVDGFDRRTWAFSPGRQSAGSRTATAEGVLTCVVRVARDGNA